MKTLVSFRTDDPNKSRLIEKAQKLGITVSELMDNLLLTNLDAPKINEDDIGFFLNHARQSLFLRRRLYLAYKLSLKIKANKKRPKLLESDVNKLLALISDTFHKRRTLSEDTGQAIL